MIFTEQFLNDFLLTLIEQIIVQLYLQDERYNIKKNSIVIYI